MVRNDGTSDEKKFLGITPRKIRVSNDRYIYYNQMECNPLDKIQAKDISVYHRLNNGISEKNHKPDSLLILH